MATDDESRLDHDDDAALSEERQRAIDDLGHRAGAALRRPAPEHGVAGIMRHARNQRLIRGGVAVAGVVAIVIVGTAVLRGGENRMTVTNTVPAVNPATTIPPSTTLPTATTIPSDELTVGVYGAEGTELDAWPMYVEFRADGTGRLLRLSLIHI